MGFTSSAAIAKMTFSPSMEVPVLPLAAAAAQTAQDALPLSRDSTPPPPAVAVAPSSANQQQALSSINEAESLVDLSALLFDKTRVGSPVPTVAESDVASVSTRTSITSYSTSAGLRAESFYFEDDNESTASATTIGASAAAAATTAATVVPARPSSALIAKRPLPSRTISRSPSPPPPLAFAANTSAQYHQNIPAAPPRQPLQWEFAGLTLWIELEEFSHDLTNCIRYMSHKYGVELIPQSHMTAIYGMEHLSEEEACERLRTRVRDALPGGRWPKFRPPIGIVQDVAVAGNPGQVW